MIITEAIAIKVRDAVDAGLVAGVGQPIPGQMCVEAAVCYALGLPHGDDPGCVSPALRQLKIVLNDLSWSSAAARAQGLRRLAVAQLGSKGVLDDAVFVQRVTEMTIRVSVPHTLRHAARLNPQHADALESAAVRCEIEGTSAAARAAADVAAAAAAADTADTAAAAAAYAAAAAAARAARAADAAAAADVAAARARAAAAAYDAAYAAADTAAYAAAAAAARAARAADAAAAADAARAVDAAARARAAAADTAAYAAAARAARAADAAARAVDAADAAYAAAARGGRAAAYAYDASLADYAERVVRILIDMQAPGCQWLTLVPKEDK